MYVEYLVIKTENKFYSKKIGGILILSKYIKLYIIRLTIYAAYFHESLSGIFNSFYE